MRPSSIIIIAATPRIGFDEEAMRKMASFDIARSFSTSIRPWALKWTTLPRRATTVTAPWSFPSSMYFWITASISSRPSLDMPTSSGLAVGISPAESGAEANITMATTSPLLIHPLISIML
jgi:hypothetical protein